MTSSSAPSPRPEIPAHPRRVHLIAIAGVGMASLAGMFRDAGYEVTGSDAGVYPPMSTQLEEQGIRLNEGYKAPHLQPAPDLVIAGLTVIDPLVAVTIGITILNEAAAAQLWQMLAFLLCGAVAIVGVFLLARVHPGVRSYDDAATPETPHG